LHLNRTFEAITDLGLLQARGSGRISFEHVSLAGNGNYAPRIRAESVWHCGMSVKRTFRRAMRQLIEHRGYWVRHRSVLPFGVDYHDDIRRLATTAGTPIEVFFDVGANVGQTSLEVLDNFPEAIVYAFEPHEATFAALSTNVRSSRFHPFNLALSDRTGDAQFFDYGALATSNSLVGDAQYAARAKHPSTIRTVTCDTLDGICNRLNIDHIDVLKVDTEGHDLAVLKGAERMLSQHRIRFVYVEFNTLGPKADTTGGALLPISSILEPLGYRFVASYAEYMITTGEFFVTSNALFFYNDR
jgi:FkbM family methyltransferase